MTRHRSVQTAVKSGLGIGVLGLLLLCLTAAAPRRTEVDVNPAIQTMVECVSGDSLWKYIGQLSGEEPVASAPGSEILRTRYSLGDQIDLAAEFLKTKLESHGLDVEYDPFVVGQAAFYAVDFVDYATGWVVANDGAVYGTQDGGRAWSRRRIAESYNSLWGICFVDHDRGWVCGAGGGVYGTRDGGETWSPEATPAGVVLRRGRPRDHRRKPRQRQHVHHLEGWSGTAARSSGPSTAVPIGSGPKAG